MTEQLERPTTAIEEAVGEITLTIDGIVADENGEIIEADIPAEFLTDTGEPVITEKFVNWVLRKLTRFDSLHSYGLTNLNDAREQIKALQEKTLARLELHPDMIELRAVERNSDAITKRGKNAASFFRDRFSPLLGKWASIQLQGRKERNISTPYGKVQLTKQQPKIEVRAEDAAITFLELTSPAAVKKTFMVSLLDKGVKERLIAEPEFAESMGFFVTINDDKVTLATGVSA